MFLGSNLLTGLLGLLAVGSYVAVYTPLKRTSAAALFVGAVPGALPPLMGWTAVTGRLDAPGLALFAMLFLWQIPHFLAIAHLPRRRLRARRLQGAAADRVGARHARDHRRVLGRAGGGRRSCSSRCTSPGPRYALCAALLGAVFIGWAVGRLPPRRREPLGALAVPRTRSST